MHPLTVFVLAASILTNINSLKNDPVKYQTNIFSKINTGIAFLVTPEDTPKDPNLHHDITLNSEINNKVLSLETENNNEKLEPTVTDIEPTEDPIVSPTTTPSPTETPIPKEVPDSTPTRVFDNYDQVGAVERAANEFGVDMNLMKSIATCESRFNAYAYNEEYDYAGLFQFNKETWIVTRNRMGADPDPELRFWAQEAARTAAFKIKNDGPGAWSGCL